MDIHKDFEQAVTRHWIGNLSNLSARFSTAGSLYGSGMFQKSSTEVKVIENAKDEESDPTPLLSRISVKSSHALSKQKSFEAKSFDCEYNYLPMSSTELTWFLERRDKPMNHLKRKAAFRGVLNEEGGVTLLAYLLHFFRKRIVLQYYRRRNQKPPKDVIVLPTGNQLGNKTIGFQLTLEGTRKTVGHALREEMFLELPFGVDNVLDAGMYQFEQFITPIRRSLFLLVQMMEDEDLSVVKRNAAKSELTMVRKQYAEAFNMSYARMKTYIEKLKKDQKQAYIDAKKKVLSKNNYRPMTLTRF